LLLVSEQIGYGVFATERIPRGTVVWVLDDLDQRVDDVRAAAIVGPAREMLHRYTFLDSAGVRILCWDNAKYVNHHCEANCLSPGFQLEIAIRDIEAGEELTDDYGSLNLEDSFDCACGSRRCRGIIGPPDFESLAEQWDDALRAAVADVASVDQPLWEYLTELERGALLAAAAAPRAMPSIRAHFRSPVPAALLPGASRRRSTRG
jgi:hypothetical protein